MLVELPFAGFFLSKLLGTSADVDIHHLASLDPEVYRNLLFLKSYEGDVEELGLNFTVVNNDLGEAQASGAGAPAPARVLLLAHAGATSARRRQVEPSHLGMPFCVHTRASCCGSLCTFQLETRRTESQGSGSRRVPPHLPVLRAAARHLAFLPRLWSLGLRGASWLLALQSGPQLLNQSIWVLSLFLSLKRKILEIQT